MHANQTTLENFYSAPASNTRPFFASPFPKNRGRGKFLLAAMGPPAGRSLATC